MGSFVVNLCIVFSYEILQIKHWQTIMTNRWLNTHTDSSADPRLSPPWHCAWTAQWTGRRAQVVDKASKFFRSQSNQFSLEHARTSPIHRGPAMNRSPCPGPEQVCSGVGSVTSTWMSGLKASQQNIALWPNGRCCYLHLSEAFHCTEGFLDSLPTADRKPYMFQSPPSCMWIFLSNRTEVLVELLVFSQVHRFIKLWVEGRRWVMSSLLLEKSLEVFLCDNDIFTSSLQLINFLTNPFRLSPFHSVANSVNKKINPCCECGANNL